LRKRAEGKPICRRYQPSDAAKRIEAEADDDRVAIEQS